MCSNVLFVSKPNLAVCKKENHGTARANYFGRVNLFDLLSSSTFAPQDERFNYK